MEHFAPAAWPRKGAAPALRGLPAITKLVPTDWIDFENLSKLRTAVYPSRMAPIGAKLCQNAFQVIPDVSFFDAGNKKKSKKIANFEGPFTPRGWLRSARNLAKIRFR